MSTRFPLHSPGFLPGLFRRRCGVGRWACCSRACRFCRIKPLAMAAAMSPPKETPHKQPGLRPRLRSLQPCPPEGTDRRGRSGARTQADTNPLVSPLQRLLQPHTCDGIAIKSWINPPTSRYSIFGVVGNPRAIGWRRAAVHLSVTFHRALCQPGSSGCHWAAPPTEWTGARVSPGVPMARRRRREPAEPPPVNGVLSLLRWMVSSLSSGELCPLAPPVNCVPSLLRWIVSSLSSGELCPLSPPVNCVLSLLR